MRRKIIHKPHKLFLVCGPTGSGKTEIISQLDPSRFEIMNFDSRQVYQHLEIGTSKPDATQRARIRHHLIDFLRPDEQMDAAAFVGIARQQLTDIYQREKLPVISCGTGFYLRAFLYGMYAIPDIPAEIRQEVEQMAAEKRWQLLGERDEKTWYNLNFNDQYRVIRALEVVLATGEKWSDWQQTRTPGILQENIHPIGLFIDWSRDVLYERINQRAEKMVTGGMLAETQYVLERYGENCPALKSLGYNFAVENIQGKIDSVNFYESFAKSHRNYAKKQITWFKKEPLARPMPFQEALEYIKNNSGE